MRTIAIAPAAWRVTAARPTRTALLFDFDGTLAPIADDPADVWPDPGVIELVAELSRLVGHVAIVSARPVEFLRDRCAGLPQTVDLHGLYGLELLRAGETHTDPRTVMWAPVIADLAERARAALPGPGIVEFKRLTLALHYRTAPQHRDRIHAWAQAEADRLGLALQPGRMVVELQPPHGRDKGTVVAEVAERTAGAWYFGDDMSDLKAFRALRTRAAEDPAFQGVCIAVRNAETGDELAAEADLTLDSPAALTDFLSAGLAVLRPARHNGTG